MVKDKDKKNKPKKSKSDSSAVVELQTVNLHSKYRPKKIEDYVGQEAIFKTFSGWKKTGKVPSTLLITGQTGSGKTTLARLLARYVNCDTFNACGKCPSCKLDISHHPDIIQSDMGNKGKVDDVRALVESARLSPRFKRRVFIIDEAHLMSSQAESALLVPTEEPDAKTMWIFCTTDPEKMKATMLNRCVRLSVLPIAPDIIADRLAHICEKEGIDVEGKKAKKALTTVAEFSDGQMRRAISLLQAITDQVIGAGEKLTDDLVMDCFSSDPEIQLDEIVVSLLASWLDFDLHETIKFLRKSQNPRGVVSKLRWLLFGLIGHEAEANKFMSSQLKMFLGLCKQRAKDKDPITYSLPRLIHLQKAVNDTEVMFNTTSLPSDILLETNLCALMVDLHEGKVKEVLDKSKPKKGKGD